MGTESEVRRGRPKKKENREKLNFTGVKLTSREWAMLETLRLSTGKSRSDILREALFDRYETYKKEQVDDPLNYEYFDEYEEDMDEYI